MKLPLTTFLVLLLAVTGCGKQEPAPLVVPKAPPQQTMPALQSGANVAPPPTQGAAAAPAPPATVASSASDRPMNSNGEPLSDLEWLNRLLEAYRMRASTSDPASELVGRKFKNQDEEMAAIAAIRAKNRVVVRDLSDLVKAGLIKSIPAAPPGKKYVIDAKSGQAVMANQ